MKTPFILGILSLLVLSACSLGTGSCVNDNYCSSDELIRGGCSDCKPDFAVGQVNLNYRDDGGATAFYCIENLNGQYEGDLDVYVHVGGVAQPYTSDAPIESVSFNAPVVQMYGNVRNEGGKSVVDFNLWQGDEKEVICSSVDINAEPSREYWVSIQLDPQNKVEERDDENNYYGESFLTGVEEHYPWMLVEKELWNYRYDYSDMFGDGQSQHFIAYYTQSTMSDTSYSIWWNVDVFPSVQRAQEWGGQLQEGTQKLMIEVWRDYETKYAEDESATDAPRAMRASDPYYATVYYKQYAETENGKFYLVTWTSNEKVVSTAIFVPTGNDVINALMWDSLLREYAMLHLPDGASAVPEGCWQDLDMINRPEARTICEANGGKIETLERTAYDGSTCEYVTCTLPSSMFLSVDGYKAEAQHTSFSQYGEMSFLDFSAPYSDGESSSSYVEGLLAENAADARSLFDLFSKESTPVYDTATKVVLFESNTLVWLNGHRIFAITYNDGEHNYVIDWLARLKDYSAWHNATVARQFQNPVFKAYIAAYPSNLTGNASACQFTEYPRSLLSMCVENGGTPVANKVGSCSVPGCNFVSDDGGACTISLPSDAEIQSCKDQGRWYEITTATGCPAAVCRPTSCPSEGDIWRTCADQGQQVLMELGTDGCYVYSCGTCEYNYDYEAAIACREDGGAYLYAKDGTCGTYKCIIPPKMS